jgi:hypothetical protein
MAGSPQVRFVRSVGPCGERRRRCWCPAGALPARPDEPLSSAYARAARNGSSQARVARHVHALPPIGRRRYRGSWLDEPAQAGLRGRGEARRVMSARNRISGAIENCGENEGDGEAPQIHQPRMSLRSVHDPGLSCEGCWYCRHVGTPPCLSPVDGPLGLRFCCGFR